MRARYFVTLTAAVAALALSACGSEGAAGPVQPASDGAEIVAVAETEPYRTLIWKEGTPPRWNDPHPSDATYAGFSSSQAMKEAPAKVQEAIMAAAPQLAAIDYPALSLPAFVTYTRAFTPAASDFNGANAEVDAYATEESGAPRWALYRWVGPTLPPHPDRPLVTRWIHVYALYDTTTQQVVRLAPTIWGQVEE
jgi:hypothetical protein